MKMLALNIQQMDGGGYVLMYGVAPDTPMQAYAACSTLPEVFQRLVLPLAERQFSERPLAYQGGPAPLPPIDDGTLPNVVTRQRQQAQEPGLLDRLQRSATEINLLPVATWLGALALASRMVWVV